MATNATTTSTCPDINTAVLCGTLSSDPRQRELPSGSVLLSLEVTTQPTEAAALSVPVVMFDPPKAVAGLASGDTLVVLGQVRRRFFHAGGATVSRTEVVATKIVPARQQHRVRALLDKAAATLDRADEA